MAALWEKPWNFVIGKDLKSQGIKKLMATEVFGNIIYPLEDKGKY